jgi:outer membrane receptor for ferrienterochelin and colicins
MARGRHTLRSAACRSAFAPTRARPSTQLTGSISPVRGVLVPQILGVCAVPIISNLWCPSMNTLPCAGSLPRAVNTAVRIAIFAAVLAPFGATAAAPDQELDELVVTARARALEAGVLADTIQQTEVVDLEDLRDNQSAVLSDALTHSSGVRVNNECSMCGYKRIMLNGLNGQHTTILVDGLPAHTLVSGFYGPDALATAGVQRVEVARGPGASLTAPEAIGGTVNIVLQDPSKSGLTINGAGGGVGYRQGDITGSLVSDSGLARLLITGQYDKREQFDGDDNGVSENPLVDNRNVLARASFDPGDSTTIALRAGYTDSVIFGGPVIGDVVASRRAALDSFANDPTPSASLFVDDDVRNRYIGKPWETTEWIDTERTELAGSVFHAFSPGVNLEVGVVSARHDQDSFYEGFDYRAKNKMNFTTARLNWAASEDHLLTFGVDRRDETLRSASNAAAGNTDFVSDSFNYLTQGLFVQETWTPSDQLELNLAARLDRIHADFIDPSRPGREISETLLSPRMDMRYRHNEQWTSRFSAGRGYRAPLSFFETDHGILDAGLGFQIDVDRLERSVSASYALSFAGERVTWTGALAWTSVSNLAVLDETVVNGNTVPLLTQLDRKGRALSATLELGFAATDELDLTLAVETVDHDSAMRAIFGVAAIEDRVRAGLEWHPAAGRWDVHFDASWAGKRSLTSYGYEGFQDAGATIAKSTNAGSFVTADLRVEFAATERLAVYAGARNLFNYNQAKDQDSPLFFDADGGYDVGYVYGPLRGRETYAGLRYAF